MKYKIIFSYDGSKYLGYAIQKNTHDTIQEKVENCLSIILNNKTKIYASGRTDKGVHALNQVACFETENKIDKYKFLNSINKLLPNDIYVKNITKVSNDFDARISAISKTYLYVINYKEYDPINRNYEVFIKDIDFDLLKKSSLIFIGKHNFQNYTSKPTDENNFERIIYSIKFKKVKNKILIEFNGSGFMRYMVRKIVGTMIEISKDKFSIDDALNYLNKKERDIISYTAIPKGLYLKEVKY